MGVAGINGAMTVAGINQSEWGCRILNIGWGLSELVDIKGGSRNE